MQRFNPTSEPISYLGIGYGELSQKVQHFLNGQVGEWAMTKDQFDGMLIWASEKRSSCQELPWTWFQYLKLEETLGSILSGMAASIPLGSLQLDLRQGRHRQLVGHSDRQESAQPHQSDKPV
jgi:hypothetical protein